ncbi:MAG TPA: hypothetical protein VNF72_16355, partial [Myxococcota bacterium]|nr:hypothetical protein [Myxococcota bacterium]
FRMQDGLLTGAGTLETPGLLTWNAGTMSGSGTTRTHGGLAMNVNAVGAATKTLAGSRTLDVAGGNAIWTAGSIDFGAGGATLRNQASFTVTGPTRLLSASGGPGQIVNEGTFTLNLDNPFAQITVMPNTGFEHSGTLDLQRGVLELRGTFQQTAGVTRVSSLGLLRNLVEILEFEGGVLAGNGLIHANVESAAVMEPGFPDATGTLSSQGRITLLPGSELRTEIAGLQQGVSSDFVTTTETIALGGDLRVSFLSGFENTIAPGDTLSVMESHPSQPLTGVFANVASGERVITTPDLGSFVVRYGAGSPSGPHRVVLSEYRAFAPETTLPVHGSAQGGEITFTLAGVPVVVTTTPGMTAEQVAAAIADAINQNDDLARLGIAAVAAGTLVTISGAVDSLVVSDSGIVIGDLPEVPALSLPLQVLLASLLVAMGARRSRRLAHA